jgi:hypothetical protein
MKRVMMLEADAEVPRQTAQAVAGLGKLRPCSPGDLGCIKPIAV